MQGFRCRGLGAGPYEDLLLSNTLDNLHWVICGFTIGTLYKACMKTTVVQHLKPLTDVAIK